jgi:hypothetical protein
VLFTVIETYPLLLNLWIQTYWFKKGEFDAKPAFLVAHHGHAVSLFGLQCGRKSSHLATKIESTLMLLAVMTPYLLPMHWSMTPKWMQRAIG